MLARCVFPMQQSRPSGERHPGQGLDRVPDTARGVHVGWRDRTQAVGLPNNIEFLLNKKSPLPLLFGSRDNLRTIKSLSTFFSFIYTTPQILQYSARGFPILRPKPRYTSTRSRDFILVVVAASPVTVCGLMGQLHPNSRPL